MRVRISYSDGRYELREADDKDDKAIYVHPRTWAAYQRHVDQDVMWHDFIRVLDEHQHCEPPEQVDPNVPF